MLSYAFPAHCAPCMCIHCAGASQSYVFYEPKQKYKTGDSMVGNCLFNRYVAI